MHRPAWFGEQWRYVTTRAPSGPVEYLFPSFGAFGIKRILRRHRCRNRQLIKLQRCQLAGDQILRVALVGKAGASGDWKSILIRQSSIDERALPVHLRVRDISVPI